MKNLFKLSENKTTAKSEILGGITIFLSMLYILAVNPLVLGDAGMDMAAVFTATAIAAAFGSILMGLIANLPIGLAPGMGLNALFAYTIVLVMGIPYEVALAGVIVAGIIFMIISFTGIRKAIVDAIPKDIKIAISAGIGFFIAFIGLQNAGIIVSDQATLVGLGNIFSLEVSVALVGLLVTLILMAKKVNLAILYGMIVSIVYGIAIDQVDMPTAIVSTSSISFEYFFCRIFTY